MSAKIWSLDCHIQLYISNPGPFNRLRLRQNGHHFPDIFKWIFLNENVWISNKISLKFVPKVPINNIQALVQIMAWSRSGDKPLSEPMMDSLLTHICVTRPQWVQVVKIFQGFFIWHWDNHIAILQHMGQIACCQPYHTTIFISWPLLEQL